MVKSFVSGDVLIVDSEVGGIIVVGVRNVSDAVLDSMVDGVVGFDSCVEPVVMGSEDVVMLDTLSEG